MRGKSLFLKFCCCTALILCLGACLNERGVYSDSISGDLAQSSTSIFANHALPLIGDNHLSPKDEKLLESIVYDYLKHGKGQLHVKLAIKSQPATNPDQITRKYISELVLKGVKNEEINLTTEKLVGSGPGNVKIKYKRFIRKSIPCPNPQNKPDKYERIMLPAKLGCSTRNNITAMVSQPADLSEPRPLSPADNVRRSSVLQNYRSGTPTQSQTAQDNTTAAGGVK